MERLIPPPPVLDIARRLESAGFEAWCVGGAIRDALLGERHLDWDLATSAHPTDVRRIFGARSTIPVGIEFGTVGVLDRDGTMHEVTTFRRDVLTDGRHAKVEFGASLDDDLARRDLTINAIAYSPTTHELRDPFGGRRDLERQLIRAVGDPDERMREDRLRALRAIRFSARFGFVLEPQTRAAIERSAPYLGRLSAERVKQELDKTMEQVRRPSAALRTWRDTGAFTTLIPALASASDAALAVPDFLAQPGSARRPARRTERFAGLLVTLGARDAAAVLTGLRASKQEIQQVGALVERYHTVGEAIAAKFAEGVAPSDADVRRWVAAIGRLNVPSFTRLLAAIWAASATTVPGTKTVPGTVAIRGLYRRLLRSAYNDAVDLGGLAVDGDDLRRAGMPAGPRMGSILQSLLAEVIADPSRNTTDWLLQEARRLHQATGE
jgi:tRNA nucleotidyltransferase/poly(A) polymerase